ncbi:hypothetical protein [Streptomyces sp. NPDC046805]|uniref:hypothetical protein n=1 Tax=Streptomyces sp. NPDC046805 TaxID=3155134 RepID=UPI0033CE7B13
MVAVIAALVGTLLGSLTTIGAAIVSGWAQREGVRISTRAEHLKEKHQPRRQAYRAFIEVTTDLKERFRSLPHYDHPPRSERESLRREINARWVDLSLLGPASVIAGASHVRNIALDIVRQIEITAHEEFVFLRVDEDDEQRHEAAQYRYEGFMGELLDTVRLLGNAVDEFALIASAALDDDGTKPQTSHRRRQSESPNSSVRS